MPRLEALRADHAEAVLLFERDNRAYFASSISDRGDSFFEDFAARYAESLAEQDAGDTAYFVLVTVDEAEVLGRFNLYDLDAGTARLGYRMAQRYTGRGLATAAVRELCEAAAELGAHTLTAATSRDNIASQKVLTKAGFVLCGVADPAEIGGTQGLRYRRDLDTSPP